MQEKTSFLGRTVTFERPQKGDFIAFFNDSRDPSNYFVGIVTLVRTDGKIHVVIFEPNGFSIRKSISPASDGEMRYHYLPLDTVQDLLI